jgi:hypothetical protein
LTASPVSVNLMALEECMPIDLRPLLVGLSAGWVALPDDLSRLIAHDPDIEKVIAKAKELGFADPVLLQIPEEWLPTIA